MAIFRREWYDETYFDFLYDIRYNYIIHKYC